jgi:hypothetical protein
MLLLIATPLWAAQGKGKDKGQSSSKLDGLGDVKIGSGLKEALKVGTENAVNLTGRTNGYLGNKAIKILMPKELQVVEKGLRTVGYGKQVDEFVVSMNRAAEKAAPQARDIFWSAIGDMTIEDGRKILTGGDTSATQYFKGKTSNKLATAFRPTVDRSLHDVGATRQYQDLVGRAQSIPFAKSVSFDLTDYVVGKALDGLFHVVGEEEKKIRKNPAARTTDLLKEVFNR